MTSVSAVPAGSRPAPVSRVLQVTPAALEQEVTRLLRRYAKYDERVLLLRAEPGGHAPSTLTAGERQARIVGCVSPLDVLDQVTRHVEADDPRVLVVLTTAEETDLGPGLLGHAIRQRIFTVEPWRLIEESFGAQHRDPRLTAEAWAGEALLDAMPPGGWPKLPGTVLTLDTAMRALATRRLGLHRLGRSAADLDAAALLLWSCDPEAVGAFRTLRDAERRGLVHWLSDTFGGAVEVLFSLVEDDKAGDALALGLVCGTLWAPQARDAGQRAQGGVLSYIRGARTAGTELSDQAVIDFADVAVQLVGWMLAAHGNPHAARYAHTVLDRAEELLGRFGAESLARHSALLRSGFDQRIDTVAAALGSALRDHGKVAGLAAAVADLRAHTLADLDGHRHRVRRAEMAQRLMQWMATADGTPEQVTGVEAAVTSQVAQWGWVDRAGHDVWQGEDVDKALQRAYLELHTQVAQRRRALDEAFAARLAEWTQVAAGPTGILTVEGVLPRVLAPLATAADGASRPVLFLVLDGMSAAVAAELGEQLRAERWEEYDPLGNGSGNGSKGGRNAGNAGNAKQVTPHRRGVVAALPTVTRVSRASLFAGRICDGTQAFERSVFEQHPAFRSRTARLFHKGDLPGNAGETLGEELARALGDDETPVVAVVLNTIDERLDKGHETAWRIKDITGLRALLDHARNQGRALVITSDHGHVLDHGSTLRRVAGAQSARHRAPGGGLSDGEVELAGPRVAGDGGRTVALWDPDVRYTERRFGYHGGASLAEVTVPLLAFLPLGATPPKGWSALPDQTPSWWSLEPSALEETPEAAAAAGAAGVPGVAGAAAAPAVRAGSARQTARTTAARTRKPATTAAPPTGQGQLDLTMAEQARAEAPLEPSLVGELLATELFKLRHRSVPRKVQLGKIRSAVEALTEAGGVLPLSVLAQRLGEPPVRASGFAATLGLILNVDSYPVLEIVDGGRNLRLDTTLLRRLFELTG